FTRSRSGAAAVNVDDPRGMELAARVRADGLDLWTYAVDDDTADLGVGAVTFGSTATRATIVDRRDRVERTVDLPLVGSFNLANALAAAATARAGGFAFDIIAAGLAEPVVVPGRLERVDAGQPFAVLVDYAHTPDALRRLLAAVRPLAGP